MKRMVKLPLRRVAAVIARKTGSLWETTYGKPPDRQAFWNYFTGRLQEIGRPDDCARGCRRCRFPVSTLMGARMKSCSYRFGVLSFLSILAAMFIFASAPAGAATIVALGASNTYGKGVARHQAYPAQLEAILRAKGANVRVVNAGINGDTTEGMLQRLDRSVPNGTSAVILQPGGNDRRKGSPDRTSEIQSRLKARGIPVIMIPNGMFRGLPHQPDGQHLTPEGYRMLADQVASQVAGVIGR